MVSFKEAKNKIDAIFKQHFNDNDIRNDELDRIRGVYQSLKEELYKDILEKQKIAKKKRCAKQKKTLPKKERSKLCCASSNKKKFDKNIDRPQKEPTIKIEDVTDSHEDQVQAVQKTNKENKQKQNYHSELDKQLQTMRNEFRLKENDLMEQSSQSLYIADLEARLEQALAKIRSKEQYFAQLTHINKKLEDNYLKLQFKYSQLKGRATNEKDEQFKQDQAKTISKLKLQLEHELERIVSLYKSNNILGEKCHKWQKSYSQLKTFTDELGKQNESLAADVKYLRYGYTGNEATSDYNGNYYLKLKDNEMDLLNKNKIAFHRILINRMNLSDPLCNKIEIWLDTAAKFSHNNPILLLFHFACKRKVSIYWF